MSIPNMGVSDGLVVNRKFRWILEWLTPTGDLIIPKSFVRINSRPNLLIEEVPITYGTANCWIPGKSSWESITATYFDTINDEGGALMTYWLTQQYQQYQREPNQPLKIDPACAVLGLYDGCGQLMETWELDGAIITGYSFGELDYSSYDEQLLEVTIRYTQVHYINNCTTFSRETPGSLY